MIFFVQILISVFNQLFIYIIPILGSCQKVCCDEYIEETCYSDFTGEMESCALIAEGGCPCSDGEVKCRATEYDSGMCELWHNSLFFHFVWRLCLCFKFNIHSFLIGYCTRLCCDDELEETCFSKESGYPESCALIENGGCPCPEGQVKCGAFERYAGKWFQGHDNTVIPIFSIQWIFVSFPFDFTLTKWLGTCMDACCDPFSEETCYEDGHTQYCALIADGGCPCPEGQIKCGATKGYAGMCGSCLILVFDHRVYGILSLLPVYFHIGYCTSVCCDPSIEETCIDFDTLEPESCALIADGGCPCRHMDK